MATCRDLIGGDLEGRELAARLDELFPNFACEQHVCSAHSPCRVADSEDVVFLLIDPLHYDEVRDKVVPEAFQELTKRDLSVLRRSYLTLIEAAETRQELIDRSRGTDRKVDQVCIGRAQDIRVQVDTTGRRVMGVLDTALPEKVSHASVFTSSDVLSSRVLRKIVRERIHAVMTRAVISFEILMAEISEHDGEES